MEFVEIKRGKYQPIPKIQDGYASVNRAGGISFPVVTARRAFGVVPDRLRVCLSSDAAVIRIFPSTNGEGFKVQRGKNCITVTVAKLMKVYDKRRDFRVVNNDGFVDLV